MAGSEEGLAELARAVATLSPQVSKARKSQLNWVKGELHRAARHPDWTAGDCRSLRDLLALGATTAYLQLAREGTLRVRQVADPARDSAPSERVRIRVLRQLGESAGVPVALPPLPKAGARPVVPPRERGALHTTLVTLGDRPGARPLQVRWLSMIGVILDCGPRAGEMCAMSLEDLAPGLDGARLLRRPQARAAADPYAEIWDLSGPSRAAMGRWLELRHLLVSRLQGSTTRVWVSLHGNHEGVPGAAGEYVGRDAGMPLQPRGLARSYTLAVSEFNDSVLGEGLEPLPRRMEQLRRGALDTVHAAGEDGPPRREPGLRLPRPSGEPADVAAALAAVVHATEALLQVPDAVSASTQDSTAARKTLAASVRAAWALGTPHRTLFKVVAQAGLVVDQVAAAGYHPRLLTALDRAAGVGRPNRAR